MTDHIDPFADLAEWPPDSTVVPLGKTNGATHDPFAAGRDNDDDDDRGETADDDGNWLDGAPPPRSPDEYAVAGQGGTCPGTSTGQGGTFSYFSVGAAKPILNDLWTIKGVLPRQGVAVLYGPSGAGKTFVSTDLLMAPARGVDWRGHRTKQTAVLYLAPDGGRAFANRLCAYRLHHGITDAPFFAVTCPIDILGKVSPADVAKLNATITEIEEEHGVTIGIVAIDTVSRAMPGGDENAPQDMSRFVDNLGRLCGDGRLIIGIHHTPKADPKVVRGHGSLHGAADCELNVHDGTITVAKQRDGQDGTQFSFKLKVVELGYDEDGDVVTSCVAIPADKNASAKPGKVTLSDGLKLALKALNDALDTHGTACPFGWPYPEKDARNGVSTGTSRLCPVEAWRATFYAMKPAERDTQKKAFQRATESLQVAGIINVHGDEVWLTGHGT